MITVKGSIQVNNIRTNYLLTDDKTSRNATYLTNNFTPSARSELPF